jgi:hypothetical protein
MICLLGVGPMKVFKKHKVQTKGWCSIRKEIVNVVMIHTQVTSLLLQVFLVNRMLTGLSQPQI